MDLRRYVPVLGLIVAVVALQAALSAAEATYYLTQITMSVYYAIVALGLSLLMGCAGQVSLGHAGFFAIGGYTAAFLTTFNLRPFADAAAMRLLGSLHCLTAREDLYGTAILHVSPWPAFVAALLLAGGVAVLIGLPVIRLRGHYLAMATLGFGIIIYRLVLGTRALGEADGLSSVPAFPLLGALRVDGRAAVRVQNYYIAWGAAVLVMVIGINLLRSRIGRALRAIHESEEAAHSLGIPVARLKLSVFILSALLAAAAGAFTTHYNGGIGPSEMAVMKSVRYVALVAVGGMSNLWGVLFMGVLLNFLSLRGVFGSYDDAVFGAILVGMMVFAPQGLVRVPRFTFLRKRRHHGASAA